MVKLQSSDREMFEVDQSIAQESNSTLTSDLRKMKLVNCATAEEEDIIIKFPWDPKSLISTVAQATDLAFGRHVLVMALKRFCRKSSLRKILTIKRLPTCTIRENPYLCPGHLPYDNFVDSLIEFLGIGDRSGARNLAVFERFLESAADEAGDESFNKVEEGGIRTVFHGTDHAAMDAILNSGLDPTFRVLDPTVSRVLDADFFGLDYKTSLGYYGATRSRPTISKLLVFMVINPRREQHSDPVFQQYRNPPGGAIHQLGEVMVMSNKFELPIAEITLN